MGCLIRQEFRLHLEQAEPGQLLNVRFHAVRVQYPKTEHLVPAADADDVPPEAGDGLGEAALLQVTEVGDGGLAAGEDENIATFQLLWRLQIGEGAVRLAVECVEVGEV